MSISTSIRNRIKAKKPLELFSYASIGREGESYLAISKELSRLNSSGHIKRLQLGVYYKPKKSRFGEVPPAETNILEFLLFDQRKRIGYISGERLYNAFGLSTQVSSVITIATNELKRSGNFYGLKIRYVKANGNIGKDDIELLKLLDVIKDIDKILDSDLTQNLKVISTLIKKLPYLKKIDLLQIAKNYPPRVKALIGSMLNEIWKNENQEILASLKSKISNTNKFKYPVQDTVLANAKHWNIYDAA